MKLVVAVLLLLTLWGIPSWAVPQTKRCIASVFVLEDLEKTQEVPSPDGRYRIILSVGREDDGFGVLRVLQAGTQRAEFKLSDLSGGIFVAWAPDSGSFYFMWSNGGAIGGYSVRTFVVGDKIYPSGLWGTDDLRKAKESIRPRE